MKIGNPFRKRQSKAGSNAAPATPAQAPPSNGAASSAPGAAGGSLELINYTPEELVRQVDESLANVSFGASRGTKFMDRYSDIWALVGPCILLIGTIGEVVLVLWIRQRVQNALALLAILAVAAVLEGTFLAVSYKSATIRGRAAKQPAGPTASDKHKLRVHLYFWLLLAAGVCATQVIFIVAQTDATGIGQTGVWTFAILRSVFTLVADGYTAFAHEESPTSGEKLEEERQERAKVTSALLLQKRAEVTIVNDGILAVREAKVLAEIKESDLATQLQLKKLENEAHVKMLQTQHEQGALFTMLQNNVMRAAFDPAMPERDRTKVLTLMSGLMNASQMLPPGHVDNITEEGA